MGIERAQGAYTGNWERQRRAGQRLLVRVTAINADLRYLLKTVQVGAFLLDEQEEEGATLEAVAELRARLPADLPPLIGGAWLRGWPKAPTFGRAERLTEQGGRQMGADARALGYDFLIGPCGEVGNDGFSDDPRVAAAQLQAWLRGARAVGLSVAPTGAPGRLRGRADLEIPDLRRALLPFLGGLQAVVAGTDIYPALDEALPAHRSARVLPRFFRSEAHFEGVILAPWVDPEAAEAASVDACWVEGGPEAAARAFEALIAAEEEGLTPGAADAQARLQRWREAVLLGAPSRPALPTTGAALAAQIDALGRP